MPDPSGFLKYSRATAPDRPVSERLRDYREVHLHPSPADLQVQARRCMGCGIPFCHQGCPLHNRIPDWNSLVERDSWRLALEQLHQTNNFPEFTGRLCPAPCESSCVLAVNDDAVAIKDIERAIVDRGFAEGWIGPALPLPPSGRSVAVVGSGPAGLAAAQQLARAGHRVQVFEQEDLPGGLLRYGIPDYKLPKAMLDRRLDQMRSEGVTFSCSVEVGGTVAVADLLSGFNAVCLALGARQPRELAIPGRELSGVHLAMEYLEQQNRRVAATPSQAPEISAKGKRVVILGGGDTGADCLGNALREGTVSTDQMELLPAPPLHRAADNPWPQWPLIMRTSPAHEEGGQRIFGVETVRLLGRAGRVEALELRDLRLSRDPEGRSRLEPIEGTMRTVPADLVLLALGFTGARLGGIAEETGLEPGPRGGVVVDSRWQTGRDGLFACGDAVRGASLVVTAIAEGRQCAAAIDLQLRRPASEPDNLSARLA